MTNLTGVNWASVCDGGHVAKEPDDSVTARLSKMLMRASVPGRIGSVLAVLVLAVAGCSSPPTERPTPTDPAVVHTEAGALRGVSADDHRLFAGIPYAAPPVGPWRFQPPRPALPPSRG